MQDLSEVLVLYTYVNELYMNIIVLYIYKLSLIFLSWNYSFIAWLKNKLVYKGFLEHVPNAHGFWSLMKVAPLGDLYCNYGGFTLGSKVIELSHLLTKSKISDPRSLDEGMSSEYEKTKWC